MVDLVTLFRGTNNFWRYRPSVIVLEVFVFCAALLDLMNCIENAHQKLVHIVFFAIFKATLAYFELLSVASLVGVGIWC